MRPDRDRHSVDAGFGVCPHCWHLNGPMSRICLRCRADMSLVLQESGGERWTAAVQSPVPVRGGSRLSRTQRAILFSFVVLFAVAQLLVAFAPPYPQNAPAAVPGGR